MGCVLSARRLRLLQEELEGLPVGPRHFESGRLVGEGGFGRVKAVQRLFDSEKTWFAMKMLKKETVVDRRRFEEVFRERDLLSSLRHARICNLYFAFQDDNYLYLVMDLALGGDLRYQLNHSKGGLPFSETRTRIYAAQLIDALDYVHSRGVLHRDVKPENILLTAKGWIMLTDFGIARETDGEGNCVSGSGTAGYMAPELYTRAKTHDRTSDWFSLAVTLHELMTRRRPFHGDEMRRAARSRRVLSDTLLLGSDLGSGMAPLADAACALPAPLTGGHEAHSVRAAPPSPLRRDADSSSGKYGSSIGGFRRMPVEHLGAVAASSACIDLLQQMLCFDRRRRIGAGPDGASEFRRHPWFQDGPAFCWARIADGTHPVPFVPEARANFEPAADLDAALMGTGDSVLRRLAPEEQSCFDGYEFDHSQPTAAAPLDQRSAERSFRTLMRADTSRLGELPRSRFAGGLTGGVPRRSTRSQEGAVTGDSVARAAHGEDSERSLESPRSASSASTSASSPRGGAGGSAFVVQARLQGVQVAGSCSAGSSSSGTSEAAAYSTTRSTQSEATGDCAADPGLQQLLRATQKPPAASGTRSSAAALV